MHNSEKCSIHSVYKATEGEGFHIGTNQIFVRYQGCAIGCVNCDSMETWSFDGEKIELSSLVDQIESLAIQPFGKIKRVSITGGDPLHPQHVPSVHALVDELKARDYFINIEAAGTRIIDDLFEKLDFISCDYKTPSTGVKTRLNLLHKLIQNYEGKYQIKAVVADERDFLDCVEAFKALQEMSGKSQLNWFITPCYEPNEEYPGHRIQKILDLNQQYGSLFRVVVQQHKMIYGTESLRV